MLFRDRSDAGRQLAERLAGYRDEHPVVLALPRGGVPVGYEIAHALGAPLDVVLVRKLGAPGQPELAMGAVAEGGMVFLNDEIVKMLGVTEDEIAESARRELEEIARRARLYRGDRPPIEPRGRVVILVDDGIATGATMRVAIRALRAKEPKKIVLAVPVAAPDSAQIIRSEVDDFVCLATPEGFYAVGQWYRDFRQTTDGEVIELLRRARGETGEAVIV